MKDVFVAAAHRTAVVPKGGAFAQIEVASLAAEVLRKLAAQLTWDEDFRLEAVLGNALYGGGKSSARGGSRRRPPGKRTFIHARYPMLQWPGCYQLWCIAHRKWYLPTQYLQAVWKATAALRFDTGARIMLRTHR